MVLREYNRADEKNITRDLININFNEEIEEEELQKKLVNCLEDYYKEIEKKEEFIDNYLNKNKPVECYTCPQLECDLYSLSGCHDIGIRVKTISNEKGIYYRIHNITKSKN